MHVAIFSYRFISQIANHARQQRGSPGLDRVVLHPVPIEVGRVRGWVADQRGRIRPAREGVEVFIWKQGKKQGNK